MISVAEAQQLCLALVSHPLPAESVALTNAYGRVLATPARSLRAQPPFAASAMDGYALHSAEVRPGAQFRVIGEAPAGRQWDGNVGPGEALRIFTGAPVPKGANHVVIQEDTARQGDIITLLPSLGSGDNIRPAGTDFPAGFTLDSPRLLSAPELSLLAAMNVSPVNVTRRPVVALLSTGDELVMPGEEPRPDQIIASNIFALKAMVEAAGATARIMPIARDNMAALDAAFDAMADADIQVSVGGASVGDHDLVGAAGAARGLRQSFHRIAMRPGKPLMAGAFDSGAAFLGLPGNPVSAVVCGHLFLLPMIRKLLGLADALPVEHKAQLTDDVAANGPRAHYMRARLTPGVTGWQVTPFDRQDSSLLTVLSEANALLLRPPHDPVRRAGEVATVLPLQG